MLYQYEDAESGQHRMHGVEIPIGGSPELNTKITSYLLHFRIGIGYLTRWLMYHMVTHAHLP